MTQHARSFRRAGLGAIFAAAATALSLGASAPAVAQEIDIPSGVYEMDPTHATLIWRVRHLGMSDYIGRMMRFDATLTLDVDDPEQSSITATVDPTSVDTPFPLEDPDFDGELATDARFLNAEAFPEITFASTSVERTGPSTAIITGDLTFLGVTQEIQLEATLIGALAEHPFEDGAPAIGFSAVGEIDRTAFGMNFLSPFPVGPAIGFEVQAEFVRRAE